jgi:arylsulfatase A-like enzyme
MSATLAQTRARRPNLVFVLTDDQRLDSLGCYGNRVVRTPHIDRLAAEGTLFEQATITSAICTPSRACYFLGQYERRHGVNFNSGTAVSAKAWARSYPVLLREAGYFTGYVGKNHVPVGEKGYGSGVIEESFDFWYGAHNHLTFYPKGRHKIFAGAKAATQAEVLAEGAASFLDTNESFLAGAKVFLAKRPAEKPFCLSIAFNLPHRAGTGSMRQLATDPELYRTTYREKMRELPLPPHYTPKDKIDKPRLPADVLYASYRQTSYDYVDTEASLREHAVRVLQTVTGIDNVVGQIRAQLEKLGVADNTVIVYASDHGIMEGEYGLGGKALNYEPCLRVPMIIYDPRVPAAARGQRRREQVQSIDIAPTLLHLAGEKTPAAMQGRSLLPIVRGERVEWREYAFAENLWSTVFGNPRVESVRDGEWKYIRYFATERKLFETAEGEAAYAVTPGQRAAYHAWLTESLRRAPDYEELFHIAADPEESRNLAGDARQAGRLKSMRAACAAAVRAAKGDVSAAPDTVVLPQGAAGTGD